MQKLSVLCGKLELWMKVVHQIKHRSIIHTWFSTHARIFNTVSRAARASASEISNVRLDLRATLTERMETREALGRSGEEEEEEGREGRRVCSTVLADVQESELAVPMHRTTAGQPKDKRTHEHAGALRDAGLAGWRGLRLHAMGECMVGG